LSHRVHVPCLLRAVSLSFQPRITSLKNLGIYDGILMTFFISS
jgi:hypothetical protein